MSALPKILCVDDEPSILQSLERVFKSQFQVITSTNAREALTTLDQHQDCAVVLSDYRMPNKNGVEFLREVRRRHPLTSRAILSGQMDLGQVSAAINAQDIHKFFIKPWENDYLLIQMNEALQLHHTLRERAHFEHLALTDPVTLVSNHRFFQDQLRRELAAAPAHLALLLLDVDHFKAFNDRFGHPEGDRLLRWIAKNLEAAVGTKGYVSRYGGEEFTLILPNVEVFEARAIAEDLRAHFERTPFSGLSGSPTFLTMSSGLAVMPTHGPGASELIENADRALYQAKRQGRNQVAVAKV